MSIGWRGVCFVGYFLDCMTCCGRRHINRGFLTIKSLGIFKERLPLRRCGLDWGIEVIETFFPRKLLVAFVIALYCFAATIDVLYDVPPALALSSLLNALRTRFLPKEGKNWRQDHNQWHRLNNPTSYQTPRESVSIIKPLISGLETQCCVGEVVSPEDQEMATWHEKMPVAKLGIFLVLSERSLRRISE